MHVSCAVEKDYVPHSAAMLHSVLANREGLDVQIHYLHGPDFAPKARRQLTGMVEANGGSIEFLGIPDRRVEELPTKGFTGKATWYRVFLPELLPDVERLLYLDADLVALEALRPLWGTELGDHYLAAVTNVLQDNHRHRPGALGLAGPEAYFNAGVLLMNLAQMREERKVDELLSYSTRHAASLEWRDQDALNVVLGDRRLDLHPRWNCTNAILNFPQSVEVFGATRLEEARNRPAIRHFEGPAENKPWHYMSDQGLREKYFEHRRHTPWPRVRLQGRTPLNVWRRRVSA